MAHFSVSNDRHKGIAIEGASKRGGSLDAGCRPLFLESDLLFVPYFAVLIGAVGTMGRDYGPNAAREREPDDKAKTLY